MIILISLLLLIVVGVFLLYNNNESNTGVVGAILVALPGTVLVIALISLIVTPMEVESNIDKFLATKATIETARKAGVNVENAAIQHKIIESNQWLAKEQYYNSTIFGLWIPDEVDNLKPIR